MSAVVAVPIDDEQVPPLIDVNAVIPVAEPPAAPVLSQRKDVTLFSLEEGNINSLAAHCNIPLALLAFIRHENPVAELATIKTDISQALAQLEHDLVTLDGYDSITKKSTHYCLCAMADTVLAGDNLSEAESKPSLFLQTHYGVNFEERSIYDMALRLLRSPNQYREVLEIIYLCINLDFDQFQNGRDVRFATKRQDVLSKIRDNFSAQWREGTALHAIATQEVVHKPYQIKINLPVWPIYVLTPLALAVVYWLFNRDLNARLVAVLDLLQGFK
jgi:type IV/VI secretion system ImpK/VasF family protein